MLLACRNSSLAPMLRKLSRLVLASTTPTQSFHCQQLTLFYQQYVLGLDSAAAAMSLASAAAAERRSLIPTFSVAGGPAGRSAALSSG